MWWWTCCQGLHAHNVNEQGAHRSLLVSHYPLVFAFFLNLASGKTPQLLRMELGAVVLRGHVCCEVFFFLFSFFSIKGFCFSPVYIVKIQYIVLFVT